MYIKNTSIFIEKVISGFLGYSVIYFLWINDKYCGSSLDGENWKLKLPTKGLTKARDV